MSIALLLPDEVSEVTTTEISLGLLMDASEALQNYCGRRFDERVETRQYTALSQTAGGDLLDAFTLLLDDDLKASLAVATNMPFSAETINDGNVLQAGTYKLPVQNTLRGTSVIHADRITLSRYGSNTFLSTGDPQDSIWVRGIWGYGGRWVKSSTALSATLNDSAETMTVTNRGNLQAGMLLKIGDEYLYCDALPDSPATQVNVTRAFNGSEAAEHATALPVLYWQPLDRVRALVRRLAMWAGEQIKSPAAGSVTIGDFSYPVDMSGLPKDVYRAISDSKLQRRARILGV